MIWIMTNAAGKRTKSNERQMTRETSDRLVDIFVCNPIFERGKLMCIDIFDRTELFLFIDLFIPPISLIRF